MTVVSTMAPPKNKAMAATKTETKNNRVYVRLNADIKDDFEKVAKFRGLTTSAMLHSFIVRTVHEVKMDHPDLFLQETAQNSETDAALTLSEKLVAKKNPKASEKKTFTTGDGASIPLVDEGEN